jgi:hypothetical protein
VLGGLTLGTDEAVELKAEETSLLAAEDLDSIFGDDLVDNSARRTEFSIENVASALADTEKRDELNRADTGTWNFILIRPQQSALIPSLSPQRRQSWPIRASTPRHRLEGRGGNRGQIRRCRAPRLHSSRSL